MDKATAVKIVREFVSGQFPKQCTCCGKHYPSLKAYLQSTTHVGKPISSDAEKQDWRPSDPIGTFALQNCSCGTTMALDSSGMNLATLWKLMTWAKSETKQRGISMRELLEDLRNAIDESVLQDTDSDQ
jgi:hypothetical protein